MKIQTLFILICTLLLSCSHDEPKGKTAAEVLYKRSIQLKDSKNYLLALEKVALIKSNFPYSFYATEADLLKADILYLQEEYVEAAASYLVFKDLHPTHPQIAYVTFRIAESYFKQIPETHDKDLESAFEAKKYYWELLNVYPNTAFSKDAKDKIETANNLIRGKEKYIADFYLKTKKYQSAQFRYNDILRNFDNKELVSHSVNGLLKATLALKNKKEYLSAVATHKAKVIADNKKEFDQLSSQCEGL